MRLIVVKAAGLMEDNALRQLEHAAPPAKLMASSEELRLAQFESALWRH
jgi:hypothetical protein